MRARACMSTIECMQRVHLDVSTHTQATPEAVFELLADGATWPAWSPIECFELERHGDPTPEGVGAIRAFREGPRTRRDQIVEVVPGRRLCYVTLSGTAARDCETQVDLDGSREGTAIRWRASFCPRILGTGWLVKRGLHHFLEDCARGLARHAARDRATTIPASLLWPEDDWWGLGSPPVRAQRDEGLSS
jgi:uncharacterized protein YndB with AHSA1/START domain